MSPASSMVDHDVRISTESPLRCVECQHSLRGINVTGYCPESGTPVAHSDGVPQMTSWGANDLHLNGERGGNAIHRGVFLIALGVLVLLIATLCQTRATAQ